MAIDLTALAEQAVAFGFSHAGPLDAATLKPRQEVRDMCAAGKCKGYNSSWACPPACGTLEEMVAMMSAFKSGLIVQTTAELEDNFDIEGMRDAADRQREHFIGFRDILEKQWPGMVALGSGGCRRCDACTWPDAPCRHPEQMVSSMEACGLVVSDVCADNGIKYYYGPQTLTYTSCYLLEKKYSNFITQVEEMQNQCVAICVMT